MYNSSLETEVAQKFPSQSPVFQYNQVTRSNQSQSP